MGTQQSIQHGTTASDVAIRTQQAQERRAADAALRTAGRLWESSPSTVTPSHCLTVEQEEVYVVVDLTNSDIASCAFIINVFPYKSGDRCVLFNLQKAQAVLRLARIAATSDQLDVLEHTSSIVGYTFKTREEVIQRFPCLVPQHITEMGEGNSIEPEEALAKFFHDTYERLAPEFQYKTRASSAVPWTQVPTDNKQLMIAVCKEVVQYFPTTFRTYTTRVV